MSSAPPSRKWGSDDMAGKITGAFGARGKPGGEAISERLTELAGGIKSSAASERGLEARLKYLTNSPAGYQAMERAGISVTPRTLIDRKSTRLNSSHVKNSYAVFCLKKKSLAAAKA